MINKVLKYIFNMIVYHIANLTPKDANLWLFGSWFGTKYEDNSKYLFEYINNNHPEIRAIWISDNDDIVQKIKKNGNEAYHKTNLKLIFIALKAKVSIFTQSNMGDNLMFLNNKNTILIQLWHGSPIKKIVYDDRFSALNQNHYSRLGKLKGIILPFIFEQYDLIVARSNEDKKIFTSAFRSNNVQILGYPRNDVLKFREKVNSKIKNIIYLPTFRNDLGSEIDLFNDYKFEFSTWINYLNKNGIVLHIKMHPVNKLSKKVLTKFKNNNNINIIKKCDLFDILPNMDLLITDYSSIYFDYLLTGKPIIFSPFDYDVYIKKDREFYFDYDDVTPGPKCLNWEEVLDELKNFNNNYQNYEQARIDAKLRFHHFNDSSSSKRVYSAICNIIEEKNDYNY